MHQTYTTYYQSPIGRIKVEGTDHYISELTFVDDDSTSCRISWHPLLHQCVEELIEYFNGNRRTFDVPVHQSGTAFQHKVWGELLNINFGKTISYMDLAKRMGDPKTIRAAASSNGKNKICILIPCHRVIGSNQSLVGYVGGLWRKKWLLKHETAVAYGVQTLFK